MSGLLKIKEAGGDLEPKELNNGVCEQPRHTQMELDSNGNK